eukprot:3976188-Amphidinium_carterae.1
MPSLRLASSTGSKRTKPDKLWTKVGSPLKTSMVTRKLAGAWAHCRVPSLGACAHGSGGQTRLALNLVAPKFRDRPEAWPRARLPARAEDAEAAQVLPGEPRPQAPRVEKPHTVRRVVEYNTFARCLNCNRQTGK